MKKNLWILLAISALIAMFVISGCQKAVTPTPTPTPKPTAKPTPTPDAKCPEVVSTDVYKYYEWLDCDSCVWAYPTVTEEMYTNCFDGTTAFFKIVITFDENIDELVSTCVYNPNSWTIKVINTGRIVTELTNEEGPNPGDGAIGVESVEIDGKKIIVTAGVAEWGSNTVYPAYNDPKELEYVFCGLICNSDDATSYAKTVNGPFYGFPYAGVKAKPTFADEVYWELGSACVIADELGNYCCGFSGKDCCIEPICETCEPCPIEGSICD